MKSTCILRSILGCTLIAAVGTVLTGSLAAREIHVATTGDDAADGSAAKPLRTIQAAAERALPGDVITVREGVYRERIDPPRGGESADQRVVYQAAPGEKVAIKGSEVVKGWEKVAPDTWKVVLPTSFFGKFNPYADLIKGDWFNSKGREHHTGAVYLAGHWLVEAAALEEVMKPAGKQPLWFATVDEKNTTLTAQFPGIDPNRDGIEVNVRQAVFYPSKTGRNLITVRGFTLEHAATNWAPPTAEQVGLIGTHWSKGWGIADNTIRYSLFGKAAIPGLAFVQPAGAPFRLDRDFLGTQHATARPLRGPGGRRQDHPSLAGVTSAVKDRELRTERGLQSAAIPPAPHLPYLFLSGPLKWHLPTPTMESSSAMPMNPLPPAIFRDDPDRPPARSASWLLITPLFSLSDLTPVSPLRSQAFGWLILLATIAGGIWLYLSLPKRSADPRRIPVHE